MTVRIDVSPELLRWARARSGIDDETWDERFPRYESWLSAEVRPTLRQLEEFARKTHTPIGFLLLDEPPVEAVPIPDFRTLGDRDVGGAVTADLLDTIYVCQARQEWYRDKQLLRGEPPLGFVSSATMSTSTSQAAGAMRSTLGWDASTRQTLQTWDGALTQLRENAEAAGVLVLISGIVGSNTHRKLDPESFRGFALVDPYAPLVFVNGTDAKAAQVFTLAHELAHLWLGSTGLSDLDLESVSRFDAERWCNEVAAEFLVPMEEFLAMVDPSGDLDAQLQPLAERFRVSTQVILGRLREAGIIDWNEYMTRLRIERERASTATRPGGGGGNFYYTKPVQVGKRFARELITSTLEGRTTYAEAFRLLGVKKTSTLQGLAEQLGVG